MEIKIGVRDIARELTVETEQSAEQVEADLRQALNEDGVLVIDATRGRRVLVSATHIGYLDLGPETARKVGFDFGEPTS